MRRSLARCGTAMLAARLYAREATNQGVKCKVLPQDEALRIASNIARAPNLNARSSKD